MFVAIIFGGFEYITIWSRFNLAILLEESELYSPLVTTNFGEFFNSPILPNKSSPIIYRFTVNDHVMAFNISTYFYSASGWRTNTSDFRL